MVGFVHTAFNDVDTPPPWFMIFSNWRSKKSGQFPVNSFHYIALGMCYRRKNRLNIFFFQEFRQNRRRNCVRWSVIILESFPYLGKWSLLNFLLMAFVLARFNGYNTTYFENASMVEKIYLKPPFDAGNGP